MSMGSDCDDGSNPPAPASREGLLTFRAAIEQERSKRQIGPAHEPKRLRVYVSGKMTGLPFLNYPAFIAAGLQLTGAGFDVVNPATLDHGRHDGSWASHMRVDIKALMDCDGVALLPGWQDSKGARTEFDLAQRLGMDVRDLADWLKADHFRDAAQMVEVDSHAPPVLAGTHRPAAACASVQACVGASADSVRSTSYDVAPGECVMCFARDPEQQRKCAEIHPGVCDVRPLPGAGDSEGGEL